MALRILEAVGAMNRAGTETWLIRALRRMDRSRFKIDFLVHTAAPCDYDEDLRLLGSRVIPCLGTSRPWTYVRRLRQILHEYGPYDVVHSHVHHFSGLVLKVAHAVGVPVRIAHSHNDTSAVDRQASLCRKWYLRLCKHWIGRHATLRLACSRAAAAALFGSRWHERSDTRLLFCGVDLTLFTQPVDPAAVRAELGIPPRTFVIGHVGRFETQKNHTFLMDIAAEVRRQQPRMVLLLVGEGPLKPAMEEKARRLGMAEHVIFTGSRSDVPRLMLGAMDRFLFPSLFEGLGLVLVEAQAAGVPCVLSDVVPQEADLVVPLVRRVPLAAPPAVWAEALLAGKNPAFDLSQAECWRLVQQTPFNVATSAARLEDIYGGPSRMLACA